MDRAAEFSLQRRALQPPQRSFNRNSQGKNCSCLLAFCLLAVFMLTLPVFYLLARHLREPQACKEEEQAEKLPEFQKQTAPEVKPRAHMIALEMGRQTSACVPGQLPTLQWKHHQDFNSIAMEYQNGYLVIPKAGDYFVYAQVTFRSNAAKKYSCGREIKKITNVIQMISKLTNKYPIPIELLSSHNSVGEKQPWNHAIYLGATVKLDANDRLLVNVSDTVLVNVQPSQTFFGAFLT